MKGLLYKEFCLLRKNLLFLLGVIVFFSAAFSIGGINTAMLIMWSMLVGMQAINSFSLDEMANWNQTAMTMPLTRKQIVQEKFLLRNGADAVVYPEKHEAKWAAVRYTADHILDLIQLDNTHAILEVEVPESWLGKSIIELDIRKKYGVNIMAIKHNDSINVNVEPDIVLTEDITLLVLGDYKNLKKCFKV